MALRNDGVSDDQTRLITDSLVVALSRHRKYEVVSNEDLRLVIEKEGERQALGACDDSACLADLAGALDAGLVFHGSIGRLDSLIVVNLNLYDAAGQRPIGRESVRAPSLDQVLPQVDTAVAHLLGVPPLPVPDEPNRLLAGTVAGTLGVCVTTPVLALGGLSPAARSPGSSSLAVG